MEEGAWDVQELPLFAKPAPRKSYASMAGKLAPSSHKPPRQRNQATCHTDLPVEKKKGGIGVKEWSKG